MYAEQVNFLRTYIIILVSQHGYFQDKIIKFIVFKKNGVVFGGWSIWLNETKLLIILWLECLWEGSVRLLNCAIWRCLAYFRHSNEVLHSKVDWKEKSCIPEYFPHQTCFWTHLRDMTNSHTYWTKYHRWIHGFIFYFLSLVWLSG